MKPAEDAAVGAVWPESVGYVSWSMEAALLGTATSGHLVYARAGALYAAPFDPVRVEVTRDPVRVLDGVTSYPTMGQAEFALSRSGSLLYAPGGPRTNADTYRVGRTLGRLDDHI